MIQSVYNCPVAAPLGIESGVSCVRRSFDAKGAADVSSVGFVTMVSPLFGRAATLPE